MIGEYLNVIHCYHIIKPIINFRAIVVESTEIKTYINKLYEPQFRGAVPVSLSFALDVDNQSNGTRMLHICDEILYFHQSVIYFQKNSYLAARVNKIIGALYSNGLISYWEKQSLNFKYLKGPLEQKKPKRLSVGHILGGVWILLIGLVSGLIVLALEFISVKVIWLNNIFKWCMNASLRKSQ